MTEFPVPLDNLISYVKALRPGGGPLENVSDAFAVSTQLDEQSDALIGYFVDQARRSGRGHARHRTCGTRRAVTAPSQSSGTKSRKQACP